MNAQPKIDPATVTAVPGTFDLGKTDAVLLKFFFTNQKHVPQGIPPKEHANYLAIDFKHRQVAKSQDKAELGELGRHREGRVDTGEPVINNLPQVRVGGFVDELLATGFALRTLHWFEQKKVGRPTKYVVVAEFVRGTPVEPLSQSLLNDLKYLAFTAVWFCHLWDNSAVGNPTTINLVGRDPNAKAKYVLSAKDNTVKALPLSV